MNAKTDFLAGELWILAWGASVQHAGLYKSGVKTTSENGQRLSDCLFAYLSREVIPKYRDPVKEEQHYKHIDDLIASANSAGRQVLGHLGYKYGVAQKLLNLFLRQLVSRRDRRAASLPSGSNHNWEDALQRQKELDRDNS